MAIGNMVVQKILCWERFRTILACVSKQSRKVNILNMLSKVGFVSTDFSTNGAFECLLSSFQVTADYIIVKLLVSATFVSISIYQGALVTTISAVCSVVLIAFL